jgi:hypothetical protein
MACEGLPPYQHIDALWCQAAGGTWHGYYDPEGPCHGSTGSPYEEARTIQISDTFMMLRANYTPVSDTRWDLSTHSAYYCWNGTPTYAWGTLTSSSALRTYVNPSGDIGGILLRRGREIYCPQNTRSTVSSDGSLVCEPKTEYPNCPRGNPISPGTGLKIQAEQDEMFDGRPLRRYYKSTGNLELWLDQPVTMATYWAGEFDLKLIVDLSGRILGSTSSPDGSIQVYKLDGTPMIATGSASSRLVKSGAEYLLYQQDRLIRFGADGRMLSSTGVDGKQLIFTYADGTTGPGGAVASDSGATPLAVPAGTLLRVDSWTGRSIRYQRRKSGQASAMTIDPAGIAVGYEVDDSFELVRKVNFADGTARSYHYGESAFSEALTGISRHDASGNVVRASTYRYDGDGRATSTESSSARNKFDFSWTRQSASVVDTTIVDPLGTPSQVRYAEIANAWKQVWSSQAAGAGCNASSQATSYDANGNVESDDDFNGNRVCKAHDQVRNLESVRVEGLATTASCSAATSAGASVPSGGRKISTQWHPDWRIETRRA